MILSIRSLHNMQPFFCKQTPVIPSLIPVLLIKEKHNHFYRGMRCLLLPADRLVWALPLDCGAEPPGPPSSPGELRSSQPAACCPGTLEHLHSIRRPELKCYLVSFPHIPEKRSSDDNSLWRFVARSVTGLIPPWYHLSVGKCTSGN